MLFEAIPKAESDQARRYRGFIAIDDVKFKSGDECKGHCTFDSGLCKFSNDQNGNFEWKVVSYNNTIYRIIILYPSLGEFSIYVFTFMALLTC